MKTNPNPSRNIRVSNTKKADITFSVNRVNRRFRNGGFATRIRIGSAVYAAAVLEYLVTELLELAGNEASQYKKKRIIPRLIMSAILKDEELNQLLKKVTIPNCGVEI